MIIQAGSLIEIRPVNPQITDREFVPFHRIARVVKLYPDGDIWTAQLTDGSVVALLHGPEEM